MFDFPVIIFQPYVKDRENIKWWINYLQSKGKKSCVFKPQSRITMFHLFPSFVDIHSKKMFQQSHQRTWLPYPKHWRNQSQSDVCKHSSFANFYNASGKKKLEEGHRSNKCATVDNRTLASCLLKTDVVDSKQSSWNIEAENFAQEHRSWTDSSSPDFLTLTRLVELRKRRAECVDDPLTVLNLFLFFPF